MSRQQLPPQIKKIEVKNRTTGKPEVRYQVTTEAGVDPETGKRRQVRRRYRTEREAREALSSISAEAHAGTFVPRKTLTVSEVIDAYLASRHTLRPSSLSKLTYDLDTLRQFHGDKPIQSLTKADMDSMVRALTAGGTTTPKGRVRKPWGAKTTNKVIASAARLLEDAKRQGLVARNVAEHVARVATTHRDMASFTESEVRQLLASLDGDRLAHAWHLALSGLRRGEIAGLRWDDVDLTSPHPSLTIRNNRVSAGGRSVEGDPKSFTSRRTLPMPESLRVALVAARERQHAERAAVGSAYRSGAYVVSNEIGDPYSPAVLSRYWREMLADHDMRHIRLHDARHTCATLMHLQGVPVSVIAAWIGHADASLTMKLYAHSQDDALRDAARSMFA